MRPNLEKIVARSRGVAETMNKGVLFLLKKNNVELINGFAKLKGNGRIDVDGTEYEATTSSSPPEHGPAKCRSCPSTEST